MIVNKYEIMSGLNSGALLRLSNSIVDCGKRPLENHHHTMLEISLIKEGGGVYTVGERTYEILPGDVFIFSSDESHCITEINQDVSEQMKIMNVHFEPRFIWSPGNGMFDAKYLRVFLERGVGFSNRLCRGTPLTDEITGLLLSMESEFECAEPEYELIVKIRLLSLLVLLGRNMPNKLPDEFRKKEILSCPNLTALDAVMEYIDRNLSKNLLLDDLARQANMSRAYFSTMFKRLNGISPWEYIMMKRIEKAMVLLEQSDETVIEIAGKCGFNSTANFNRAFKKITGRTPSSCRIKSN